jgi:hypothetical protein
MRAAARPYVLASAALLATSLVVATPLGAPPLHIPVVSMQTRLVDVSDVPVNLFDDILNIPYNEVQALSEFADSDFFTGTWFIPSATNLWGIDPGDTSRVDALTNLALPFTGLDDGNGGFVDQLSGFLAAELPVNASCDAATCAPILPPSVITGDTDIDRDINLFETLTGNPQLGLFEGWFQVPLSELESGYTFGTSDPLDAGATDPSGPAFPGFGFFNNTSDPYIGGTTGADNAMPWDGTTYTLSLTQPFENFYESLLAAPSTSGIDGTGIDLPSFQDIIWALQSNAAGFLVDFDPFIEGSPECPATCDLPSSLTLPSLVQDINGLYPGNTTIQTWLTDYANGTANEPTPAQIDNSIAEYQVGDYNLTPTELATVDTDLANINPELPYLLTNAGVYTDPGYLAYTDGASTTFGSVYGGYNPALELQDLQTLLTNNDWNFNALAADAGFLLDPAAAASASSASSTATPDATALPSELSALLGGSDNGSTATDLANLSALLGLSGASTISTDLSALLSTVSSDLSAAVTAELGPTLSAELASILPTALASAF